MRKLSLRTQIYIAFVSMTGLLTLVFLTRAAKDFRGTDFLIFAGLILLSEAIPVQLPRGGSVSISLPIWYASLILFGPVIGTWVGFTITFSLSAFLEKDPLHKYFFNGGQFIISSALAGWTFVLAGGIPASVTGNINLPRDFLPLTLSALILFLANTSFPTLYHALVKNIPFWNVWSMNVKPFIPNVLGLTALGIILAEIYVIAGPPGLVLIIIPLLIARHTFNLYSKLRRLYLGTVRSLAAVIEAKDYYTKGHSERVADYAVKIARQMHLPENKVEKLEFAALLHDVGKISVSRKILAKPGRLTPEEYRKMQRHPVAGATILEEISFLKETIPAVYYHHEKVDGTGYADGVSGKNIPLEARILAVADSFDAMTSARPHRPAAMNAATAVKELIAGSGSQFDERVVHALLLALNLGHLVAEEKMAKVEVGVK